MSVIRAGQVELNVVEKGSGPALLLVHGFPLSHAMWQEQIEGYSWDHRVIAPDLRGFGRSPFAPGASPDGAVTMEEFADDLAALLEALGVGEPVVFCGLSMGGYIAWPFWRKYADRLRALVLCDTKAAADAPEAARGRRQVAERVLKEGAGIVAESLLPKLFAKETAQRQPQLVETVRETMLATRPEAIAAAQRGMAQRPDVTGLLGGIRVPTLIVVGAEDAISPPAEMRAMAAAIPGSRFVEIPQAGHMAPLENPAAVNQALREFLAGV